ncbi:MAG: glycosyltransferase [Sulfurospirillaceae bacterium]|nr:glycosyltransferase [Sulfurospirillaceae bacterium]MDD2826331.1 glycosyltransferase [Sulfurospirillaceae bacterium]
MRKTEPLVSVLIPSYNHESYIKEAVLSVVNQTYNNIELIIVDDGSSDKTTDILRELHKKYNFNLSLQENKGIIPTLKILRQKAKGKYIALLASDDYFHCEKIEKLVGFLEHNPQYAMVYSKITIVDNNSNKLMKIEECYKSGRIFEELLMGDFFINSVSVLINKEVYMQFDYDEGYIEDFQMWLKIAKCYEIGFCNEFLSYYRKHDNHLSSNILKMQEAERNILNLYKNEPSYAQAICKWNLRWLSNTALCYKYKAIIQYLWPSICFCTLKRISFIRVIIKLLLPCWKKKL